MCSIVICRKCHHVSDHVMSHVSAYTEDFQIFAKNVIHYVTCRPIMCWKRWVYAYAASDVEDHVFCFPLYGCVAKIWESTVVGLHDCDQVKSTISAILNCRIFTSYLML